MDLNVQTVSLIHLEFRVFSLFMMDYLVEKDDKRTKNKIFKNTISGLRATIDLNKKRLDIHTN